MDKYRTVSVHSISEIIFGYDIVSAKHVFIYTRKPYKLIGSVAIISGRVMVYVLVAGFRSTDLVDIYTTVGRELRMVELENKGARA